MTTAYQRAIIEAVIINDEGGWTLSSDPDGGDGGWTFAGITADTFQYWLKKHNYDLGAWDKSAVEKAKENPRFRENIREIYLEMFYVDDLIIVNQRLSTGFLSCKILCGSVEGVKLLQTALNIKADGELGPITKKAIIANCDSRALQNKFCYLWMHHLIDICKHNPAKIQFLSGWYNRVYRYDV